MTESRSQHPLLVVHPVVEESPPYRGVEILGFPVGQARSLADLTDICRLAGMEELDLDKPGSVWWVGGGAEKWG